MIEDQNACSCGHDTAGRGITRRSLLRGAAVAAAAGAVASTVSTRVAFASTAAPYTGDVLVVVSLRGGFDGLSAIVPAGDPYYHTARPSIGVPTSQLHRVSSMFGLHPALSPIFPLWTARKLAAVHAVGQINPTRSHFAAMQEMERAAPGSSLRTGWLDRTVGMRSAGTPFETVQLGSAVPSTALSGPAPVLAMSELDKLNLIGFDDQRPAFNAAMRTFYAGADSTLTATATDALATAAAGSTLAASYHSANGAVYPTGGHSLGPALRDIARLVKSGVGMQVACIDYGDWDMHAGLGSATAGHWMYDHLRDFALSLAAFAEDLGPALSKVTLVTLSEFGRRVAQNASGGLDHGHGNAVLVLGGGVNGGKVYGRWPGLAPSHLVAGDLAGATDYRTVLAEILQRRCRLGSVGSVFPNFRYSPLGIVRQA